MSEIINPQEFVGWKFNRYKNGKLRYRVNYVEWIYLNLIQDDVAAILTYGVASKFFPGTVVARIYEGDKVLDVRNYIKKPKILGLSETDSSVTIDDCCIEVDKDDKDLFHVKGKLAEKGNNLEWKLDYKRLVPQINAMDAESIGWFHNILCDEWLSWQVKMPTAKIQGSFKVNGKEYDIDTMGYMDSNWGNWLMIDAHWNWMHTFGMHRKSPYAIASVEIRDNPHCGDMYVRTPKKEIRLFKNKKEFEFKHLEWEKDKATGHMRPTVTKLTGRSLEGYRIDLLAKNITPYALIQEFPQPFKWVVSWDMLESLVHVTGEVKDPNGKTMLEVDSKGFKEYGKTGWLPIFR